MPLDPTLQQLAMADELLGKFPRGKTAPKTFLDYMRESPAVHGGAPSLKPSIRYKTGAERGALGALRMSMGQVLAVDRWWKPGRNRPFIQ